MPPKKSTVTKPAASTKTSTAEKTSTKTSTKPSSSLANKIDAMIEEFDAAVDVDVDDNSDVDDSSTSNPTANPASRKVKQLSMVEHAKARSMWAGSKNAQSVESYVLDDQDGEQVFQRELLKYPPALLKIIDEIVVNAIDHHILNPKTVTEIKISLSKNGEISVYNNGPGIHVEKTKNLSGVEMYTPQLMFGEFLTGSNFDDSKDRIVGGQNGIGSKLTVIFSKYFIVETYDAISKQLYKQAFREGLTITDPPEISTPKKMQPYTKITFMPDYDEFKVKIATFHPILYKIIETRAWQAAAYTKTKVAFNDSMIPIKSFEQFCQMFTENMILSLVMTYEKNKYPWEVCIAISDGKERSVSIVNGIFVTDGGTHIQHIQNYLVANLRDKVEKEIKKSGVKFNKNYITNNIFIFMKGLVPSPEFSSQTKETVKAPIEGFAQYAFTQSELKKIWELLEPIILATFLKKQLGETKTRSNNSRIDAPKYKEARFCRDPKKRHQCGLIVTEGDSASGTADTGLLAKASPNFNYDWFGVYSIGGVPVNGLKESTEIKIKKAKDDIEVKVPIPRGKPRQTESTSNSNSKPKSRASSTTRSNSKTRASSTTSNTATTETPIPKPKKIIARDDFDLPPKRYPNQKLRSNERIASLVKVLNLDYNKTYALNEIGDKEFKLVRYGFIVGLTDQDLDGFNIFGLLATYFMTYWPALVQRGFIRRIYTPIIRAYPKNKKETVREFYSERDANAWIASIGEAAIKNKYKLKYYKGLGTHKQAFKEVTQIFKNINQKIRTYTLDADAFKAMHIYYGDDTKPRKINLANPHVDEPIDDIIMPISQHFKIDTKLYQRDNIVRKLLSVPDGFVDSRRKVFYTARKNGHTEIKVQGLAGKVVAYANYQHGEASLEQTIVRMAQGYPMARNLPLLLPLGQFGTRAKGYKDYAASRYIYTTINYRLADKLFRKEDEYILEYEVDDGDRYEPKYYVPIIPYVLCEDNDIPATGWRITTYARDIKAIFKNTRDMIKGNINACKKLPPWFRGFKGKIKTYKNKVYSVGVYTYSPTDNTVHITELPLGVFSNAYLRGPDDDKIKKKAEEKKGIQALEWIADYEDNTDMDGVNITLTLKPGAYEAITAEDSKYGNIDEFDPFEDYLQLKEPIYHLINLVNDKNEVVEYTSYEDVFNDWYAFRKNLYAVRIERELILIDLEILMLKNMQKFSKLSDTYGITNKTSEAATIEILKKEKYIIFNHTILENPRFTSVQLLKDLILLEKHGATYEYILRMTVRDLTENAYNKREARIAELLERKKYLIDDEGLFPGAKLWLVELDELEKVIHEGLASEWFYGENNYKFED